MEQNFDDIIRIVETMSKYATSEILEEIISILEEEYKITQNKKEKAEKELKRIKTEEKTEKVNIKRTFGDIIEEITKENNIPKNSLFLEFDEKILSGYYFRTNETKRETIQKEINVWEHLTFKFKIATNKKALEKEPFFRLYPLTKEEIEKEKRLKKIRKEDPLYGEYIFDIKPFLPSKNGKYPIDAITREEGLSAEMAWFLNIDKYDDLYYYVEPEFIDLEEENILSKALKNILTDEEINEYYKQKNRLNSKRKIQQAIEENKKKIRLCKQMLKQYKQKIRNLKDMEKNIFGDTVKIDKDFLQQREKANIIFKEVALKKIRKDYNEFKNLDFRYRDDKEITLEAVTMDGMLLEFISEALKNDDEIVTKALRSNPLALKYAGSKYKDNQNLVLKLIPRCPEVVEFISPRLKENFLIATEAVKRNGKLLKYFPKFKNNREMVSEAVKQNGLAILYADKIFFSDKEIMLEVIKQNQSTYLITCISQVLKDNEEFMKEVCKIHKEYIKYASERLKDKKEFILSFCSTYQECIEFASERLKDDFRFELIKSGAKIMIKEIEEDMKNDANIRNIQKPKIKTILLDRIKILI